MLIPRFSLQELGEMWDYYGNLQHPQELTVALYAPPAPCLVSADLGVVVHAVFCGPQVEG